MKRLVLALVAVAAVGSTAAVAMLKTRRPELPRYGAVPAFTMTDAAGQPFGTAQLDGRPFVVDFIFTTCPMVCPRMTEEMGKLQTWMVNRGLDARARLVSVSIDPERDTPEKLRAFAHQFHARPGTWTFLTGSKQAIEDAVVKGFKVAVDREKDDSQDGFAIVHGTKFVLVDGKREIRGYYDAADAAEMTRLRDHLQQLAEESR